MEPEKVEAFSVFQYARLVRVEPQRQPLQRRLCPSSRAGSVFGVAALDDEVVRVPDQPSDERLLLLELLVELVEVYVG